MRCSRNEQVRRFWLFVIVTEKTNWGRFSCVCPVFWDCERILRIHSVIASWTHSYLDSVMTKFVINNRTSAWKPDVNLLTGFPVRSRAINLRNWQCSSAAELGSRGIRDTPKFRLRRLLWIVLFCVVVRRLWLHFRFRGYYERPLLTVGNQTFPNPRTYQFSTAYWHTLAAKLFFVVAFLVITWFHDSLNERLNYRLS